MAYTALQRMREYNKQRFQSDIGPFEPDRFFEPNGFDLKSAALRFIHDRCEGLKFDNDIEQRESPDKNIFFGRSIGENQIPYNMQMDINRLCLERELEHFIRSGVSEDAYNVYYCYLEIFFGHYGKSKKMIELLSEFESNGSSLLMKHRDHYSHSVYVFALGLAVYETNRSFREAFTQFYGLSDNCEAAILFLEYWGLTSLFHDIGYPFELPFEQVMAYYEVDDVQRGKDAVLIAYKDVNVLTKIGKEAAKRLESIYPDKRFDSTNALFAHTISATLGKVYGISEAALLDTLSAKPTSPEKFNYFMDHAWFSANRLFQELTKYEDEGGVMTAELNHMHIDALTAIILHNSLYKFTVSGFYKKCPFQMRMEWHPLAYLLMLCDELQCWDRTAYGRNSRKELHPMNADFRFDHDAIAVTYCYDIKEVEKINRFQSEYEQWKQNPEGKKPSLKAYSKMYDGSFLADIQHIVDTTQLPLTVDTSLREVDRKAKHTYLSNSSFLHLYDFAVALHNRYTEDSIHSKDITQRMETSFENISLEYQLSNINQAKHFNRMLNKIDCFYTDRPVDYEMVDAFDSRQIAAVAPLEHRRWIREHREMCWTCGDLYETIPLKEGERAKDYRERFRMHMLAMDGFPTDREIDLHYYALSEDEQGKDIKPFNKMLELIKLYDGLRIYRLN